MTRSVPAAASGLTLLGLGLAMGAVAAGLGGRPAGAFVLLIGAGLCDLFDGQVARRWGGGGSPFGMQLDSLADVVSFGAVPAILVWIVVHGGAGVGVGVGMDMGAVGAVVPSGGPVAGGDPGGGFAGPGGGWLWLDLGLGWLYASCAAFRLAGFNVRAGDDPGPVRTYRGLPVTWAALIFPALYATGASLSPEHAAGLLRTGLVLTGAAFVLPVPVPKPRGLAYPALVAVAVLLSVYLLLGAGAGGGGGP